MSASFIMSGNGTITLHMDGKVHSVDSGHANYAKVKECLKTKDFEKIPSLLDVAKPIREAVDKCGSATLKFENGNVTYNGEDVNNAVVDRIVQFSAEGFDFSPLMKFLDNLLDNPSKHSVDNLYRFIEHNNIPITEDGCILTYKRVTDDYKDCRTGNFDNSVGKVVKMRRNAVEDNPLIACSHGLHVAAFSYAVNNDADLSGNRVVVCKVNPRDVVSIPTDYNNQKMRVCEYEVVEDYTHQIKQEEVVAKRNDFYDDDDSGLRGQTGEDYDDEDDWEDEEEEEDDDWDHDDDEVDDDLK